MVSPDEKHIFTAKKTNPLMVAIKSFSSTIYLFAKLVKKIME